MFYFHLHQFQYFNPRSPRGERHDFVNSLRQGKEISILAPRGGSDNQRMRLVKILVNFNPRSPRGERRLWRRRYAADKKISILAPRGGSDRYFP